MSVKTDFKNAIESRDWSRICGIYQDMFDESIEVPSGTSLSREELMLQLQGLLLKGAEPLVSKNVPQKTRKQAKLDKLAEDRVMETPKKAGRKPKISALVADSEVEPIDEVDEKAFTRVTGPVNKGRPPPVFPCSHIYSEEVAEITQASARIDKQHRPPVIQKIKKCDKCNKDYDYNKAYPVGKTSFRTNGDSEKVQELCLKCQKR